VRFKSDFR